MFIITLVNVLFIAKFLTKTNENLYSPEMVAIKMNKKNK